MYTTVLTNCSFLAPLRFALPSAAIRTCSTTNVLLCATTTNVLLCSTTTNVLFFLLCHPTPYPHGRVIVMTVVRFLVPNRRVNITTQAIAYMGTTKEAMSVFVVTSGQYTRNNPLRCCSVVVGRRRRKKQDYDHESNFNISVLIRTLQLVGCDTRSLADARIAGRNLLHVLIFVVLKYVFYEYVQNWQMKWPVTLASFAFYLGTATNRTSLGRRGNNAFGRRNLFFTRCV